MNKEEQTKKIAKRLSSSFLSGNIFWFTVSLVARVALGACSLVFAYIIKEVVDVASAKSFDGLVKVAIISIAVVIINFILYSITRFSYAGFLKKAISSFRYIVFGELLEKRVDAFLHEDQSRYISALTNDVATIETDYVEKMFLLVEQILIFIASIVIMLRCSVPLTIVAVGFALFPMFASLITGNRLAVQEKNVSNQNAMFVSSLKDLLSGFVLIKRFHIEKQAYAQFVEENDLLESEKYKKKRLSRLILLLGEMSSDISQLGVFLVGGYFAIRGDITPGMIMMFLQMMNYINGPIATIPPIYGARKSTKALIDKLSQELMDNRTEQGTLMIPEALRDGIHMQDISFAYEKDKQILNHISLDFEAGKSYAVIGASGSGKTTLLNLLSGADYSYDGQIYYDESELKDIRPSSLFEKVSFVQQNVFLFNDSIRNNITLYRDVDDDALNNAVSLSGLSELVNRNGLDYSCGENGKNLSGGEKQRVSIARSLLFQSDVLLMDEATSALDQLTSDKVMKSILSLDRMMRIVVMHNLDESILRMFDGIVVLKDGKICEQGQFDDLMRQKGYFYALYTVESSEIANV